MNKRGKDWSYDAHLRLTKRQKHHAFQLACPEASFDTVQRVWVKPEGLVWDKNREAWVRGRKDALGYFRKGSSSVHRAVAECFVPNPLNLPIVNHIDENPSNNHKDNLEWCTYRYNAIYSIKHLKNIQVWE